MTDPLHNSFKEGKIRRIKALIKKEIFQIMHDPSTLLICVVLPLFLLFLYGFGVSLDMNHLRLGVVVEDTSPEATILFESFRDCPYFEIHSATDRRLLKDEITKGTIRGMVVIPSYFTDYLHRGSQIAPLQVIADGSEPNTANFVLNYAKGAFDVWKKQDLINRGIERPSIVISRPRVWYNEQLESRYFLLSGSLAIIMTLIGTLLTALVVAREWERGTMESIIATPVSISELILGKLIPYFLLGMISMVICIFVSVVGYGLPLRGSLWLLIFVSAIFLFSALGLGLLISTLSKNQLNAYQISIITGFLTAYILSGFLFEIASMPRWIQYLTYFLPARYFVKCLQTIFLVGNVWSYIFINIIPMIVIGLIFFGITAKNTSKRLG
jgi:ABC-2 type transport system permease protein